MATGPIAKTSVDALVCPPNKDREILWDSGHREAVRGFGVASFRNGGKCYIAQYRKDGRSRPTRIGEHGRLTPEEARRQAKIILGAVEGGKDPIAERRAACEIRTFEAVATDFLAQHLKAKRKARTAEEYEHILALHVIPALGSKRIVELRRADVARLHSKLRRRLIRRTARLRLYRLCGIGRLDVTRSISPTIPPARSSDSRKRAANGS